MSTATPTPNHPAPTSHINVSVEQLGYRPVALDRIRALAKEIVAGSHPPGTTTMERLVAIGG